MTIVEQAEHELRLLMLCKPSTARALIDEVKRLRAELARLRKAIEDAPHTTSCSIWGDMIDTRTGERPPIECDCWKRAALEKE